MAGTRSFSRKKGVKLTVVARIGCTPYTAPVYGQTCVRTLPYAYAVVHSTTRNWAHLTLKHPQSPQKWGKVIMVRSRRVIFLFLILGRRPDHHMIFHIFSVPFLTWVFGQQLFKVLRKKDGIHCSDFGYVHTYTFSKDPFSKRSVLGCPHVSYVNPETPFTRTWIDPRKRAST